MAGSTLRLAGVSELSEGRWNEVSKAGTGVWVKIWSAKVRSPVLREAVQGRWQGIWGPDTETTIIPGGRADSHWVEHGRPAALCHGKADPVQCLSGGSKVCGENLTSQEAVFTKPISSGSLSAAYLKTSPVTIASPFIGYMGKMQNAEGVFEDTSKD